MSWTTQYNRMDSGTVQVAAFTGRSRTYAIAFQSFLAITCILPFAGCQALSPRSLLTDAGLTDPGDIRGPLERALAREAKDPLSQGQKFSAEGRRRVDHARSLFDDKKYSASLREYKVIAKKYENSAIGEEAWFHVGECNYAMKQYPAAQDAYEKLFADYPSTKYVSDASRRLFSIARTWLEVTEPAARSEIRTVSQTVELDDDTKTQSSSKDYSARFSLVPNFFDKTRPLLDTRGRSLKALKAVWLNDPTGPLADDALMLTATYYLRRGNSVEADRYFEILRQEYPNSPHVEDAFTLGAHAKQMAYQGPFYDKTTLISARNLKEQSLSMFPNSKDRPKIREDLKKIYLYEAQEAWVKEVDFYTKKDNPTAVAIGCRQVIENFPDTRYARMAQERLRSTPRASYQHLPGMTEFVRSLADSPIPSPSSGTTEAPAGPPVKSVSSPSDENPKRPFRLLGF